MDKTIKHKGKKYHVTDDIAIIDKIKKGDQVFFNKEANPCYAGSLDDAKDLMTVEYTSSDIICFEEMPDRVWDFYERKKEMYKVIGVLV